MKRIKAFVKWDKVTNSFYPFNEKECETRLENFIGLDLCQHKEDLQTDDNNHNIKTFKNHPKDKNPNKDVILECWCWVPG